MAVDVLHTLLALDTTILLFFTVSVSYTYAYICICQLSGAFLLKTFIYLFFLFWDSLYFSRLPRKSKKSKCYDATVEIKSKLRRRKISERKHEDKISKPLLNYFISARLGIFSSLYRAVFLHWIALAPALPCLIYTTTYIAPLSEFITVFITERLYPRSESSIRDAKVLSDSICYYLKLAVNFISILIII